jgi:serine/threonine protein kinase
LSTFSRFQHFHDHYAVTDRKLGGGKYGSVYLAKEVSTTRQVACKIINLQLPVQRLSPSQCPSSVSKRWQAGVQVGGEEKMRAMREIKILATVSHVSYISLQLDSNLSCTAKYYQPQESFLFA